jgi:FkbM family methyltransferase
LLDIQRKYGVECSISAFEPTKKSFEILKQRFETQASVQLFNYGISNTDTQAQIFYDAEGSTLASLFQRDLSHFDDPKATPKLSETITLKTLKNHIEQNKIEKIDFLKIDIEGNELRAFEGLGAYLRPDFIQIIQFEYGGANIDAGVFLKQIFEILQNVGFVLYKITPNGLEKRSYHPNIENFQYANYVALPS